MLYYNSSADDILKREADNIDWIFDYCSNQELDLSVVLDQFFASYIEKYTKTPSTPEVELLVRVLFSVAKEQFTDSIREMMISKIQEIAKTLNDNELQKVEIVIEQL